MEEVKMSCRCHDSIIENTEKTHHKKLSKNKLANSAKFQDTNNIQRIAVSHTLTMELLKEKLRKFTTAYRREKNEI